ncbi:YibE/F family protein [Bombilactobacillus thymidiniphilus]|uniref:YibE/F family protein n=1 Tax=Bombilactobacillus thymidiniphilus TaxID=2923363 RepID=A0ABY4PF06_9LACO|nr:YibE/F family protein [Bombilactobacillus thymidiniphilus]UQS84284.1 YibE/F family protein [Bombilactobacillus thymidiniphilus]
MNKQYKRYGLLGILLLCLIGGLFYYRSMRTENIAIVQKVKVIQKEQLQESYQNDDMMITQKLTVKIISGHFKGQQHVFKNTYYQSQANSNRYFVHSKILLNNPKAKKSLAIIGPKRDGILVFTFLLIILIVLFFLHKAGLKTLISVAINWLLFIGALLLATRWHNQHILCITIILAIILSLATLILVFGYSRQTLIALLSTLISTFSALLFSVLVLQLTNNQGIHFETMDYGIQPFELIFLAETLLGVLGAVMDETSDITASLYQLLQEKPNLAPAQLRQSGMNVGQEIIGPLINILFYIFLAELIPIVVLYLRNGNTLFFSLSRTMTLGYTQTIISALGIVLAVPVTSFLASFLLRGEQA